VGFGLGDFIATAKSAFVEAAADQIRSRGDRPSAARIAVVTGLARAEVAKIRKRRDTIARPYAEQRTERVMHGWFTDSRYVDASGNPRALSMTGPGSFDELVRNYSGDIPRRAVLEELIAGGMAEIGNPRQVFALRRHYLLASGHSATDLERLKTDADVFLISATNSSQDNGSALRRVSVRFPYGIPLSVRRTVALRTERFLEALSDYLHVSSAASESHKRAAHSTAAVFHVAIAQCEADERD
jgi:hypothetical protein